MAFPSRASLRQQAADRGRWLSAITLKATNELYQRCAEHAAHLISAKAPAMQAHAFTPPLRLGRPVTRWQCPLVAQSGPTLWASQCLQLTHFGHQRPHADLAPIGFAPYIWSAAPAEGSAPASGRNLLLIRHEQPMRIWCPLDQSW